MPQTYAQRLLEHQNADRRPTGDLPLPDGDHGDFEPPPLQDVLLDADDSIVLSDLVRTGEASRLRRRGAMRIDHNHPHHTTSMGHILPGAPQRRTSAGFSFIDGATWETDEELESPVFATHNVEEHSPRLRRHPRLSRRFGPYATAGPGSNTLDSTDEYVYTLVCGTESEEWEEESVGPYKPSVLPLYPKPTSSVSKPRKVKKSSGCGAVLHFHAAPRPKFRMWTARSAASDTVVPLDARYFDTKEAARFSKSSCGCVKEGIGCAVCGNPLGTRYTPCKSASEGLFCSRLPVKRSSSNIHAGSHTSQSESTASSSTSKNLHIYTFFADAVSSTIPYTFPTPTSRPARSRSSLENISFRNTSPRISSSVSPPEPLFYTHGDEDEDSDSENFPPSLYGTGWRSIAGTGFGLDSNMVTILDSPVTLRPPSPTQLLTDRLATSSPLPEQEAPQTNPSDVWGESANAQSSSAQPAARTRTGRAARRSNSASAFPSLSSGLGVGVSAAITHRPSFYERQLQNAAEREWQDVRIAGIDYDTWTGPRSASSSSSSGPSSLGLDADGDVMVWGVDVPETILDADLLPWGLQRAQRVEPPEEAKPLDMGFLDR